MKMDTVIEWLLHKPQRIIDSGKCLYLSGFAILLSGLWGQIATASVGVLFSLAPSTTHQTTKFLAEIYPGLPTGWIPESFWGFAFSIILIVAGLSVALMGKKYKRLLG